MARRIYVKVEQPETIDLTIQVTLPLPEWDVVRTQLSAGRYPCQQLGFAIERALREMRKSIDEPIGSQTEL